MPGRNKEFRWWADIPADKRVTADWLKAKAERCHYGPEWIRERLHERADQCQAAVYIAPDHWQHRCLQNAVCDGLCKSHHTAMRRSLEVVKVEPKVDMEQLDIALEALDVANADTIIVRADVSEVGYGLIREHARALFPDKRILVLGMSVKIETLTAGQMKDLGWMRAK